MAQYRCTLLAVRSEKSKNSRNRSNSRSLFERTCHWFMNKKALLTTLWIHWNPIYNKQWNIQNSKKIKKEIIKQLWSTDVTNRQDFIKCIWKLSMFYNSETCVLTLAILSTYVQTHWEGQADTERWANVWFWFSYRSSNG